MRLETLNERIDNAKAKIEKKGNTIIKKNNLIEKKKATLVKMGFNPNAEPRELRMESNEAFWLACDIDNLNDDCKRLAKEIEETKESLKKYELQLVGELEKEEILIKEIPESMKRMQEELVESWDTFDINKKRIMWEDKSSMTYKEFYKKYTYNEAELLYKDNEQIHKSNQNDAKALILNLYGRVKAITGEVVDWEGIHATVGTHGFTVLNGFVIGKEGRAYVESILAGGYNIQRLHVRVLVSER